MPPPIEELTGFDSCSIEAREETIRVDRKEHFPKMKGFHSSYHVSTKYNLKLVVEKIDYRVETLEHIHSGKRRTADLSSLGPDRSKATWEAISLLVCVAIATALPIDRMRKLFGAVNAFSGASICRYIEIAAKKSCRFIYSCFKSLLTWPTLWLATTARPGFVIWKKKPVKASKWIDLKFIPW